MRLPITRVDLCDDMGQRLGSIVPVDMYANRDLAGQIKIEIHQKVIVVHESNRGAGKRLYFYVGRGTPLLWVASPMVTITGQSVELTPTVKKETR